MTANISAIALTVNVAEASEDYINNDVDEKKHPVLSFLEARPLKTAYSFKTFVYNCSLRNSTTPEDQLEIIVIHREALQCTIYPCRRVYLRQGLVSTHLQ